MDLAYTLHGGAAVAKKFTIGATVANAGIPLLTPGATTGTGLANATTTSAADMVGVAIDTATYTTTQSTVADIERTVTVICNPDAVYAAKMSGAATENTALTIYTVVTANAAGTSVIVDASVASPERKYGYMWGYTGANVSQKRKITNTSSVTATITVPFMPIAVGDQFLVSPYTPHVPAGAVQLTTNLYQADASIAVATGCVFQIIEQRLRDYGNQGTTNSYVLILAADHVLAGRPT